MIFTSENRLPIKEKNKNYIFLAGSIDLKLSSNWREELIVKSGNHHFYFDPTNKNHDDLDQKQMENHIKWELDALCMADKIILNFLPNSTSPISLVELGLYVSTTKLIVVCPNEFYKSNYINILCKKYKTPLFNTINEALQVIS